MVVGLTLDLYAPEHNSPLRPCRRVSYRCSMIAGVEIQCIGHFKLLFSLLSLNGCPKLQMLAVEVRLSGIFNINGKWFWILFVKIALPQIFPYLPGHLIDDVKSGVREWHRCLRCPSLPASSPPYSPSRWDSKTCLYTCTVRFICIGLNVILFQTLILLAEFSFFLPGPRTHYWYIHRFFVLVNPPFNQK